jgi:hypothetical protein
MKYVPRTISRPEGRRREKPHAQIWRAGHTPASPTMGKDERGTTPRGDGARGMKEKRGEERFLSAQADAFGGANAKEKASACSVRNDSVGGGRRKAAG